MRVFAVPLSVLVLGCALGRTETFPSTAAARSAEDVPAQFAPTGAGGVCLTSVHDPRDGTDLRLVRSVEGVGDYEVPAGRYGVAARELLRLECGTGRPIGIVPR